MPTEKSLSNLVKWPKGVSGNPGGRKRLDPVLTKQIRDMTPALFDRLRVLAMGADTDASSIAAIKLILAYAWGSPDGVQPEGDMTKPERAVLTVEERRAIARMALSTEKPPADEPESDPDASIN